MAEAAPLPAPAAVRPSGRQTQIQQRPAVVSVHTYLLSPRAAQLRRLPICRPLADRSAALMFLHELLLVLGECRVGAFVLAPPSCLPTNAISTISSSVFRSLPYVIPPRLLSVIGDQGPCDLGGMSSTWGWRLLTIVVIVAGTIM